MKTENELQHVIHNLRFEYGPTVQQFENHGGRNGNWKEDNISNGGINLLYGLYDLIRDNFKDDYTIAEIGCHTGGSAELFANMCKLVYAVDCWTSTDIYEVKFDNMMSKYNNIIKIKDFSVPASKRFEDESLDAVYIDADHTYESIREDIISWFPKIKKNGVLCGHDLQIPDIRKALNEFFPYKNFEKYCDNSWAIKMEEINNLNLL